MTGGVDVAGVDVAAVDVAAVDVAAVDVAAVDARGGCSDGTSSLGSSAWYCAPTLVCRWGEGRRYGVCVCGPRLRGRGLGGIGRRGGCARVVPSTASSE